MEMSDWIALVSAFVAIPSALCAWQSAQHARRANEIALHNEKLKVFKGVLDLRAKLSTNGVNIKEYDLFSFYEYVQLSEFYFNARIYEKVKDYFDCAWEIMRLRGLWESAEEGKKREELVQKTHEMLQQSRERIEDLELILKEHLRISKT